MTLRSAATWSLLTTLLLGTVSNFLFLLAFEFRLEWFAEPALMIESGSDSAGVLGWAAALDLFSYYLPTAVVALALWHALRRLSPRLIDAGTLAAVGYVGAGGAGAAVLATAGPMLLAAHSVPGADESAIEVAFAVLTEIVFRGIWQLFDAALLGVWWLAIGLVLRPVVPGFARLSIVLATLAWLGGLLNLVGLGMARDAALGAVFLAWDVWAIWLIFLLAFRVPPFGAGAFQRAPGASATVDAWT